MDLCPPARHDYLRGLLLRARDTRFDHPSDNRYWRLWAEFAVSIGQHPFLPNAQADSDHLERGVLFLAFAVALREGRFHHGRQVSGAQVETTLRNCAQCMVSRGLKDPRRSTPGATNLDPAFSSYIKQCKKIDPAPQPQQALPMSTVRWIADRLSKGPLRRVRIAAHLIVVAFFFLLRVGEYTPSSQPRQTIPLRKKDIKLWRKHKRLSNDSPLEVLLTADAVTIKMENQKNGKKDSILHHEDSRIPGFSPVSSMAHLIGELQGLPASTPIGTYRNGNCTEQVSASTIRSVIHIGAAADNLGSRGYSLDRIGSHSLRSGGATHLKLCGYDHAYIQKLGRWSSDTYLTYIQSQIGELFSGIAYKMASTLRDVHIISG